jgi:hypothetical protein
VWFPLLRNYDSGEIMANDGNGHGVLSMAEPAPRNLPAKGPIRIFLSHHESESQIALELKNSLDEISDGLVKIYTYKDSDLAEFRKEIEERATEADLLVFFYTAEHRDLSWISLEIGLYRAARRYRAKEPFVFCFMSRDIQTLPPILDHLERMPATSEKFSKFLRKLIIDGAYSDGRELHLLGSSSDSIMTKMNGINQLADKLSSMFSRRLAAEFYTYRLSFEGIKCLTPHDHPEEYAAAERNLDSRYLVRRVVGRGGEEIEAILDFSNVIIQGSDHSRDKAGLPIAQSHGAGPLSWNDLLRAERATENAEKEYSLRRDIMDICDDDKLSGRRTKILSPLVSDEVVSWPVISRIEKRDGVPVNLYIILIDDPTTSNDATAVKSIESSASADRRRAFFRLVKLLNLGSRFRSDILEPTINHLHLEKRGKVSKERYNEIYGEFWLAVEAMGKEAAQYDLHLPGDLPSEFDEDRENYFKVFNMYGDFAEKAELLRGHIEREEHSEAMKIFIGWQEMNREFMNIGLETYRRAYEKLKTLPEKDPNWDR